MSSVTSLASLLGAISVPGLALAVVSASARRYLRAIERQPAHTGGDRPGTINRQR
jgi:hypothetical protein